MANTALAAETETPDPAPHQDASPRLDTANPPGWSYNPSAWSQRLPVLVLALLNCAIATYLALCQVGVLGRVWDPFFGDGSMRVLNSSVSRAFPLPDAALGAGAYLVEAVLAGWGGSRRWRSKPWLTLCFALFTVPLGLTSIVLMILQPVVLHAWCTLCLVTAALMLVLAALSVDEVVAAIQAVSSAVKGGQPIPDALLHGPPARHTDPDSAEPSTGPLQGISVPWNLAACAGLGIWLLSAPAVLGARGPAADADSITGALLLAIALFACAEPVRPVRFACTACGIWLFIFAPWSLAYTCAAERPNQVLVGVAVLALSAIQGRIVERYGGWERYLV